MATTAWALEQLGTTYIDIAVLNREDAAVPVEASVACLQDLVKAGKYKAVGRGLHSSTFRLNISALCGIGDSCRGCLGGV